MKNTLHGFTLIEILIVVMILGILSVIAIAQFGGVGATARENTLRESLLQMRTQISAYTMQHRDVPPAADYATFYLQLTAKTNEEGVVGTGDGFRFGPYISDVPPNPLNGQKTMRAIGPTETPSPDGSCGWIYQPLPGTFKLWADYAGNDTYGKPFISY